ncbi:uncharacterized protein LOC143282920 [Babylonia areolata]|uniref:uncharacterized protein LOC143282920 n=1 Tax=Babylonia areolata TaxID=304850 RepID=UPI003FD4E1F5
MKEIMGKSQNPCTDSSVDSTEQRDSDRFYEHTKHIEVTVSLETEEGMDPLRKSSDFSIHRDDDRKPDNCLESDHSESKGALPIQCTEDNLQTRDDTKISRSESESCQHSQHSHVAVFADDIDLPHDTFEVQPSENNVPYSKVPRLKCVTNTENFVDKEELRLKYTAEESKNRKMSMPDQVDSEQQSPLDIKAYLKPLFQTQQLPFVYMLHSISSQVSSPNRSEKSNDASSPGQYLTELSRLATYIGYPSELKIFAITLARDGFVFHGREKSIECCFCHFKISLSELGRPDADPVKMHNDRSPRCPLKRGEGCGNVPVPKMDGNDTVSDDPSPGTSSKMNTQSDLTVADGSLGSHEERQENSSYHVGDAFLQPSPVIHHQPSLTTDSVPQGQAQTSPAPKNTDNGVQQSGLQEVTPLPNASSARSTDTAVLQGATAPVNGITHNSGNKSNTNGPSKSAPSSEQNGASASATSLPKNSKSKKAKAAKKAEAAARKSSASSGASATSTSTPAQPSSDSGNGNASSDKKDQSKEKKKLTYADLGIFAEKPKRQDMASLQKRIASFEGKWKPSFAKTPQVLADCGMYYAGYADCARCFFCGGGLKNWEAPDEPWIEHARWFPKCAYLHLCKGAQFVEIVQRKNRKNETIIMKDVEEEIMKKTGITDASAVSLPVTKGPRASETRKSQSLGSRNSKHAPGLQELEEEHEELTTQMVCKICMDERSSVVFLPCGHMVACTDCAVVLKNCPLCRADIRGTVKAHMDF